MPTTKDLYCNIEAERARYGWTIDDMSKAYGDGMSEKTYRNWRDKEKPLSCTELVRFAEIFACSVDYLLGLSDKIKVG